MHAWRWIDRNQEEVQWQLIPRKNSGRMYNLGELHGIRGLPRSRHVELLPHVVGRSSSGPATPDGSERSGSLGLDAKVGLTSNFTLDATVNPDFGQVEADPSVVNLTAYETFYDEKRPFFLEGKKILSFGIEDSDQLFYTRRIGQAPSYAPPLGDGETIHAPESTTILGAVKLTGKTNGGLSVGLLQSLTQKETRAVSSPLGDREPVVEPFGSYTVARLHKDWDKGNTSLGAMLTETHRWIDDPALAFLPTNALTAGIDFVRYFANRAWMLEARGVVSQVSGEPEAIHALQTNPVHYYQRPGATHLGVDTNATSLFGHGGSLLFGRSGEGRLRLSDHFHWYSPGLELNDLGYLKQADVLANQFFLGWEEPTPRGSSAATRPSSRARTSGTSAGCRRTRRRASRPPARSRTSGRPTAASPSTRSSTPARCEAARPCAGTTTTRPSWAPAPTRRAGSPSPPRASTAGRSKTTRGPRRVEGELQLRLSRRLSVSGALEYEQLLDNLQYVTTAESADGSALAARADRPGHLELHAPDQPVVDAGPDRAVLRQPVHRHRPLHGLQARDRHARTPLRRPLPRLRRERDRVSAGRQRLRRERSRRSLLLVRESRLQLPPVPLEPRGALGVPAGLLGLRRLVARAHGQPRPTGSSRSAATGTRCGRHARRTSSWSSSATGSRPRPDCGLPAAPRGRSQEGSVGPSIARTSSLPDAFTSYIKASA